MRMRYFPAVPGEPWATTAMRWSAGWTGVAESAEAQAATSRSSLASMSSGGSSPRMPIFFESGLP